MLKMASSSKTVFPHIPVCGGDIRIGLNVGKILKNRWLPLAGGGVGSNRPTGDPVGGSLIVFYI